MYMFWKVYFVHFSKEYGCYFKAVKMRKIYGYMLWMMFCFSLCAQENILTITTWNIQTFGRTKTESNRIYPIAEILSSSDITIVQEIRDRNWYGWVAQSVIACMDNERNWKFAVSVPLGRTSSKENYLYIYDSDRLELYNSCGMCIGIDPDTFSDLNGDGFIGSDEIMFHAEVFPDYQDWFERPPSAVLMKCIDDSFDAILINTHIRPSDAKAEIFYLDNVAEYFSELFGEHDILVAGDFNADGSYFDETLLKQVFSDKNFFSVITDEYDTTVSAANLTYDRIICTQAMQEDFTGEVEVLMITPYIRVAQEKYRYNDVFSEKNISDHYPVRSYWYTDRDEE